jgi:hypothetical protein
MAIQYATTIRNDKLDAIETSLGTAPILRIRTGSLPADCATADSGTVLATATLPSDWMAAASGGVKAKSGTWQDASADANGTAGHFRIYDSGDSFCGIQGTVTANGGGGDMQVDNAVFAAGQSFTVSTFAISDNNG